MEIYHYTNVSSTVDYIFKYNKNCPSNIRQFVYSNIYTCKLQCSNGVGSNPVEGRTKN